MCPDLNTILAKIEMLKPIPLGLGVGGEIEVIITGSHISNRNMKSIPVKTVDGKHAGHVSLNVTIQRELVPELGTNTDKWIGAKCRLTAYVTQNPRTGENTLGWQVKAGSIVKPQAA